MSEETPIQNGSSTDGRGPRGRFAKGNPGGPGNATARKAATFRAQLFRAVKPGDFAEIIAAIVREAKAGESWACKLAMEYLVGPPMPADVLERIENLEAVLLDRNQ